MRAGQRVFVFSLLFFLGACASNKLPSCPSSDWSEIGYEDGKRGNTQYSARSMRKACNELEVPFDEAAYNSGAERGAREYCTNVNAYKLGRAGRRYNEICPDDVEEDFLAEYQVGLNHHKIDRDADDLREQLKLAKQDRSRTQNHLENIRRRDNINVAQSDVWGTVGYDDLLEHIDRVNKQIDYLEDEIKKIEDRIDEPDYMKDAS